MDKQQVIKYLDELVSSRTGKHLNELQLSILKGVLSGQKYDEIGKSVHRSKGHVKDEGYKLWQLLSEVFEEDINKHNFRSIIDKMTATNIIQVNHNHINFGSVYSNYNLDKEEIREFMEQAETLIKSVRNKTKLEAIPRLLQLGLTSEQIAHALDLPLELVLESLKSED